MGKKVKLDLVPAEESFATSTLDLVPADEPVKKKDQAGSLESEQLSSSLATTSEPEPGLLEKAGEVLGNVIYPTAGNFWSSLYKSAKDVFVNQVPQIVPAGREMERPRTYEDLATRYPTYPKREVFDDPSKLYVDEARPEDVTKDLNEVKKTYPQGGQYAYEMFKSLTEEKIHAASRSDQDDLARLEESSQRLKRGVVTSRHDIRSGRDFANYMGDKVGQGLASLPMMFMGGSLFQERTGAYEEAMRKAQEVTGLSRDEIANSKLNRALTQAANTAGALNMAFDRLSFGAVSAPLKKLIGSKITGEVVKRVTAGAAVRDIGKAVLSETGTEGLQDLVTQVSTNIAAGKPAGDVDWDRYMENVIGGGVGALTLSGLPSAYRVAASRSRRAEVNGERAGMKVTGTISPALATTSQIGDNVTVEIYNTGLTNTKTGNPVQVEAIKDQAGGIIYQTTDGFFSGNSVESVAKQLEFASLPRITDSQQAQANGIVAKEGASRQTMLKVFKDVFGYPEHIAKEFAENASRVIDTEVKKSAGTETKTTPNQAFEKLQEEESKKEDPASEQTKQDWVEILGKESPPAEPKVTIRQFERPDMMYPVHEVKIGEEVRYIQRYDGMNPGDTAWYEVKKDRAGDWTITGDDVATAMGIGWNKKEAVEYVKSKPQKENAEDVRGDQGQVQKEGTVSKAGKETRSDDLQQQAKQESKPAAVKQQPPVGESAKPDTRGPAAQKVGSKPSDSYSLNFIEDKKILDKKITEKITNSVGEVTTRRITVGEKQVEIKKKFAKLKKLIDCLNA